MPGNNVLIISVIAVSAAGLLYLIYWYAFRHDPFNFRLSEIEINCNNDGMIPGTVLSVLHLSDFHLRKDRKGKKLFEFIWSLKNLKPDLLVITGDLVEKNENIPYLKEMLEGFHARYGKYAVFGVHDYYNKAVIEFIRNMFKRKRAYRKANDVRLLVSELASIGIKVLQNKKETTGFDVLNRDSSSNPGWSEKGYVEVVGVDDAIIEKDDSALAFSGKGAEMTFKKQTISRCFEEKKQKIHVLNNPGKLVLCITHTPDRKLLSEICSNGADIVLCGHTHGGQVRIPGIGAIITGANINRKYASGLFYFNEFVLYTSRGLGEGRYSPFRFYCQPEATVIKVVLNQPPPLKSA
jgi:predicted MPP superfamily phosphohydrolase